MKQETHFNLSAILRIIFFLCFMEFGCKWNEANKIQDEKKILMKMWKFIASKLSFMPFYMNTEINCQYKLILMVFHQF